MARTNNEILVNKGVLDSAANMVKLGIRWMTEKDSLSAGDTEAIRADHSPVGEIIETERKYVSEADGLVEVSFQIPCRDWMILKKSIQWHWMEKKLPGNSKQIYPEVPLREEMLIGMEREEIDLCETTAPFTFFVSS